jgi:uncharacterized protein YbjT (DUF2867 family)
MNYVITGSLGHISKPLTEKLIEAGHTVTVITSKESNRSAIEALGAKAAVGSVEDPAFLKNAFAGADAVYTMVPPNSAPTHWKEWIGQIGKNYAAAIAANNISYVVNLSSLGAHLPDGCGPVSGLYKVEQALNALPGVHIKHLRPSYFFANLLANTGMAKHMNIIGSNFGGGAGKMVLADTSDIAEVALEELSKLSFTGHSVRYIASDERTTDEIAALIGQAIDKPSLPWIVFTDEQALGGMLQAGLQEELAKNYVEMGACLRSGKMEEDYWKNHPASLGKIKLEDFVKTFAAVYNSN